ncbi:hypothetical protein BWX42_00125 [Dolosigranulum pigrum]|uniref:Uncharacterized protein n=1 Tax=Dolosigranulum pigrum TaxID=29394 RepID=A0A1S8KQY6_9LACT|nr:hypothetical protein BWX42_00125 [Dolosigranulum pigrum]
MNRLVAQAKSRQKMKRRKIVKKRLRKLWRKRKLCEVVKKERERQEFEDERQKFEQEKEAFEYRI